MASCFLLLRNFQSRKCRTRERDWLFFPPLWPLGRRSLNATHEDKEKGGNVGRSGRDHLGRAWAANCGKRLSFCFGSTEMGLFPFQPSPFWLAATPPSKPGSPSTPFSFLLRSTWTRCSNN